MMPRLSFCALLFFFVPAVTRAAAIPNLVARWDSSNMAGRDVQPMNPINSQPQNTTGMDVQITPEMLTLINPNTTACNATADFADECRNATQSAPFVNQAFADYNITTCGEKAALLSLMMFETGGFKFDRNHFPEPGNPGQGTRNLMSFPFVADFAVNGTSCATADQAQQLLGNFNASDPDSVSDDVKNDVLGLVLEDRLSFASAAWFYDTKCRSNQTIVEGLQNATREGWESYITGCVFTTVTDDREAVWNATLSAIMGN